MVVIVVVAVAAAAAAAAVAVPPPPPPPPRIAVAATLGEATLGTEAGTTIALALTLIDGGRTCAAAEVMVLEATLCLSSSSSSRSSSRSILALLCEP